MASLSSAGLDNIRFWSCLQFRDNYPNVARMAYTYPSLEKQQLIFDYIRNDIEQDLYDAGIDVVLALHGFTLPERGNELATNEYHKIVVARSWEYSSAAADIDRDLDPLASTLSTNYEIGVVHEKRRRGHLLSRTYSGRTVSRKIMGGDHEPVDIGSEMSQTQLHVVSESIGRLITAKSRFFIPGLTKSLIKIDLAGD